ncbi:MFS transporter [Nocardia sp. NBC_01503]|uniref:MFS transporter n=1 Tax=Nocardia sp. NBC_01503 TaxID=2975997 RepID=UPI002E7BE355|nr:MFS transporter [Nocardia sp. NBC_01503]WTL34652.1 MFS transporter [Nocardia sp. NBC_01503]
MRALTLRAVLFALTADLIPYYALYALLFADHGLSTAQISALLAIWSVTSFLLEVPSGAWADTVSRRGLLMLSGVLLTAGFLVWTLLPSYAGFAAGFILWGAAGALRSGTFEALIYDDLAARASTAAYPRLLGYTRAAAESAALTGILAAAPLYAWGGYALVGWSSVLLAGVHVLSAIALPGAPKVVSASAVEDLEDEPDTASPPVGLTSTPAGVSRYVHMLRSGLRESLHVRVVRRGVILVALLNGITAFDEYFSLLADHTGVSPSISAVLVGVTVAGALTGAALAGHTENVSARAFSIALGIAGVLFIGGALLCGAATSHPTLVYSLTAAGFTGIAIAYGIDYNADVLASARLQDAIAGPARATVTSVSGLVTEVIALIVFIFVGVAAAWLPIPALVAALGTPLLLIAVLLPTWLPKAAEEESLKQPTAE